MGVYPDCFYKYRAIENKEKPLEDLNLKALFNSRAVFSNRASFNDLFDSKIQLLKPTKEQLHLIRKYLKTVPEDPHNEMFIGNCLTTRGRDFLENLEPEFNKLIDSYFFYCVSANNTSNLMWSHYADSHRGFCIEFRSSRLPAQQVLYQKELPQLNLCDLIPPFSGKIQDEDNIGHKVWAALRTKLDEWSYEQEYRFRLNDAMQPVLAGNHRLVEGVLNFV
jgi:Protein of unknown function (DUF2971)